MQQFAVPDGATRLYLGVIDDGGYYENSGAIAAIITGTFASAAAEPSTWALLIVGLGIVGAFARRGRRGVVSTA